MDTVNHVSLQLLERHAAGLSPEGEAQVVTAHLATCEQCRISYEAVQRSRTEFLARNPPMLRAEELVAKQGRAPWKRWLGVAGALATASLLAIAFLQEQPQDVIEKGDTRVVFRVEQGNQARVVQDEVVLSAGNRIQIDFAGDVGSHVAVFAMDHAGKVDEVLTTVVEKKGPLPRSLILDDSTEPEALFVVVSRDPIETAAGELGEAYRVAGGDLTRIPRKWPSLLIRKRENNLPTKKSPDVSRPP